MKTLYIILLIVLLSGCGKQDELATIYRTFARMCDSSTIQNSLVINDTLELKATCTKAK